MREFLQINESVTYSDGLNKPAKRRFGMFVEPKTTIAEFKKLYTDKLIELNAKDDNLIAEVNISFPKHSTVNDQALISNLISKDKKFGKILFVEATVRHQTKSEDKLPSELVDKTQSLDNKRTIKVNSSVIFSIPESKVFDEGQIITINYSFDRSKTIRELKKDFQASFANSSLPNNEYKIDKISVSLPQHPDINDDSYIADIIGNNETLDISINVDCKKKINPQFKQKNSLNTESSRTIKVQTYVYKLGSKEIIVGKVINVNVENNETIGDLKSQLEDNYFNSLTYEDQQQIDRIDADTDLPDYPDAKDVDLVLATIGDKDEINVSLCMIPQQQEIMVNTSITFKVHGKSDIKDNLNKKYIIKSTETFSDLKKIIINEALSKSGKKYQIDTINVSLPNYPNAKDDDLIQNFVVDGALYLLCNVNFKEKPKYTAREVLNDQAPEISEEKINQKDIRITFTPTSVYPDESIQSQEYSHYYTIGKNETFGNLRQKFIDHINKQNDEDYEFDRTEISFSENINDDDLVLNTIGDKNSLTVKVETFFKEKQIDQGDQAQKDEELVNRFHRDLNERLNKLIQPTPTTSLKKATIAATAILCTTALVSGIILCKYLMNKSSAAKPIINGIENITLPLVNQAVSNSMSR